ncbi:hypothetical protein PybrP1_007318 [[Pythium] brassicae (nom. inval.)]|nr:hypothetical protein PybrP1_007318 [[Pythium] brassicae (nom. inval.)]
MIHRLVAKFDLPSYLPKPDEILDGVQWLRENPTLAAGVMVGLTSYSVAKYYQFVADGDGGDDDSDEEEIMREEIARSISAIQLGLLKVGLRSATASTETVDSLTSASSAAGSLRRRTSSVFKPVAEKPDAAHEPELCGCSPGAHASADGAPKEPCCDPDWGWFVPTSPRP